MASELVFRACGVMPIALLLQQISVNQKGVDNRTPAQLLRMHWLQLPPHLLVASKQILPLLSKRRSLRCATATWICSYRITHILSGELSQLSFTVLSSLLNLSVCLKPSMSQAMYIYDAFGHTVAQMCTPYCLPVPLLGNCPLSYLLHLHLLPQSSFQKLMAARSIHRSSTQGGSSHARRLPYMAASQWEAVHKVSKLLSDGIVDLGNWL